MLYGFRGKEWIEEFRESGQVGSRLEDKSMQLKLEQQRINMLAADEHKNTLLCNCRFLQLHAELSAYANGGLLTLENFSCVQGLSIRTTIPPYMDKSLCIEMEYLNVNIVFVHLHVCEIGVCMSVIMHYKT